MSNMGGSFLCPYLHSFCLSFSWMPVSIRFNLCPFIMPSHPLTPGNGGGGNEKITIHYWKWNITSFSLYREPLMVLCDMVLPLSPFGRWGNWDSETSASFPWVHTTQERLSRDPTSGQLDIRAGALKNCTILSEWILPSPVPQLLILLIPLKNSADCATPHSTEVNALGSFSLWS